MTIKTLLGMTSNNRNSGNSGNSRSNWTFGWTCSQAAALSANAASKTVKPKTASREVSQADRQVETYGIYGVLATRSVYGR